MTAHEKLIEALEVWYNADEVSEKLDEALIQAYREYRAAPQPLVFEPIDHLPHTPYPRPWSDMPYELEPGSVIELKEQCYRLRVTE